MSALVDNKISEQGIRKQAGFTIGFLDRDPPTSPIKIIIISFNW